MTSQDVHCPQTHLSWYPGSERKLRPQPKAGFFGLTPLLLEPDLGDYQCL